MNKILLSLLVVLTGCGGGGGSQPPATVGVNIMPVATSCSVGSSIAPAYYTGSYQIPTPNQRLNTTIQRSVGVKDYYAGNTCLYIETLNRLQALGVDRIWIYNYGPWDDFTKPVWSVSRSDWQIPEKALTAIVAEAKKRNIKVFLAWQFSGYDNKGTFLPVNQNLTSSELQKMIDSHQKNIVDVAKYAQTIGISGIALDWNAYWVPNIYDHIELYATSMVTIAKEIKQNFNGILTYGQIGMPIYDARIFEMVDELHLSLTTTLTNAENANISVGLLKDKFIDSINQLSQQLPNTTKPVIWEIAVQSRDKYFTEGWIEDGFCVNNCIQNNYVTDFSIQAMGVEAALEAIVSQNKFTTGSVDFHSSYWHTDTVTSGAEGFPNLSQSIRNKPAESIIKYWFKR
jgi:hypothetical protein